MASTHVSLISAGDTNNRRIASSIYGYCTTAAGTAAKTVSLYTGKGTTADGTWAAADLFHGLHITVRFQYSNTVASPTLNVNGTGAKPIYRYGTTAPSTNAASSWQTNAVVDFTYDTLLKSSGCWVMHSTWDNNTTYSSMSQTEATTGTATNARSISAKVLHDTIEEMMPSPLSSYHTTVTFNNDTTLATVNVQHNLNTPHVIVSVNVTDNQTSNTFIASQSAFALCVEQQAGEPGSPGVNSPLYYGVKIVDNDNIQLKFLTDTWHPNSGTLYISVISAIAYSSASDESLLKIS